LKNVPFVIGGSDGAMANLGTASATGDSLVVSIGTSCAVRIIVRGPVTDTNMRSFCYHVKDDLYLLGGAGNNGAVVLQWLREKFLVAPENLPDLLALASPVKAGSEGLIFLPYLLGERAPVWNENARGVLFGLTINHDRSHLVRAAMEAVILCVYAIGLSLLEKRDIRQIDVTGGFARNEVWIQILSDAFNLPARVSETVENAAWGAVKLGMESLGIAPVPEKENPKIFFPCAETHRLYHDQFKKSERLYNLLKTEF
jgi:gluconokinase